MEVVKNFFKRTDPTPLEDFSSNLDKKLLQ